MLKKRFIAFFITSIYIMMTSGDLLTKRFVQQDDLAATSAATYIPFIMNLIKSTLSRKEKFEMSQNVYNAFRKKLQEEEEKVLKENEEKAIKKKLNEPKSYNVQHLYKNKPYYLRF